MNVPGWRREWTELALVSVVSVVLYEMNMLVLFLLPLQILYVRRGERDLARSAVLVVGSVAAIGLLRLRGTEDSGLRAVLMTLEFFVPAAFVGGLVAVNYQWRFSYGGVTVGTRVLERLLSVTAAVGAASIPLLLWLTRSDELQLLLRAQVELVRSYLEATMGQQQDLSGTGLFGDTEALIGFIRGVLLRNYLFVYYIVVSGSIWVGSALGNRTCGGQPRRLASFRLPDWPAWPLLIAWAAVLVNLLAGTGTLDYAAWNVGLIFLFTYGIQGVGIIHALIEQRTGSRGLKTLVGVALVMLLLWPGVNLLVIIGLPGLGVSEIWIKLRDSRRNEKE